MVNDTDYLKYSHLESYANHFDMLTFTKTPVLLFTKRFESLLAGIPHELRLKR